jgi:plasmid stabilization system protein ParE
MCRLIASGERQGRRMERVKAGYLSLTCKAHSIIYRETASQILVVRILHQQ